MSMKQLPPLPAIGLKPSLWALLCLALVVGGCGESGIRVYTVPKEKPSQAVASTDASSAGPQVHWQLPAGWEEREGDNIRFARFAAAGKEGQEADIAVIPLLKVNAPESDLVNLWRKQIGLPDASVE